MSLLCKNWPWVMLALAQGLFTTNDTSEHFMTPMNIFTLLGFLPFFYPRRVCLDMQNATLAGFISNR
jgi:hypothetical protein